MKPVSFGLIGVGYFARSVLIPALDLVAELRWAALATSREETAREAAAHYRVPGYANYLELLDHAIVNSSVNIESVKASTATFYAAIEGRQRVRIIAGMEPVKVEDWSIASSGGLSHDPQPFAARLLENNGSAPQFRAFARAIREGHPLRFTLDDAVETRMLEGGSGPPGLNFMALSDKIGTDDFVN